MALENKVGKEKHDWRQWVPVYGIFQTFKDGKNGKPSVLDDGKLLIISAIYQGISTPIVLVGLAYLADKYIF